MSDGESTTPAPRQRPSYGLPGPTSAAPGAEAAPQFGTHNDGSSVHGSPNYGEQTYGEQAYGAQSYGTQS